jgi:hypothetical protein
MPMVCSVGCPSDNSFLLQYRHQMGDKYSIADVTNWRRCTMTAPPAPSGRFLVAGVSWSTWAVSLSARRARWSADGRWSTRARAVADAGNGKGGRANQRRLELYGYARRQFAAV